MLPKKLKLEKLPTASKEKVNNILMKLETSVFQSHLHKEESVTVMHVQIL
jgi:hypothetical protein